MAAISRTKAKYQAMVSDDCQIIWVQELLKKLQFRDARQMTFISDNQDALHITSNLMF